MKATRDVTQNNSNIAHEWYKNGRISDNTQYTRDEAAKRIRIKPKSPETRSKEAQERRYQNRKNVCSNCFELKAVGSGTCSCD